jgi:hypothetical protein
MKYFGEKTVVHHLEMVLPGVKGISHQILEFPFEER